MSRWCLALSASLWVLGCSAGAPPTAGIPASSEPTVLAHGAISSSADPLDLAIDGTAYFVLARVTPPRGLEDLVFTREGDFHAEFQPGSLPHTGTYRLQNPDGLTLMGWRSTVDQNVRPFGTTPEEAKGTDLTAFRTSVANGPQRAASVELVPLELALEQNPDASNSLAFDARGLLRLNDGAPRALAGGDVNMHVVLAEVEMPAALSHQGGGYLTWTPAAGMITAGTASDTRAGRRIGAHNVLRPAALERLPLLTPSRYDRERYPDALDPLVVLPRGEATVKGALVSAVRPVGNGASATFEVHLVALADGVATDRRWVLTLTREVRPIQRRGDVLRPVVLGGLSRGAIVDVWADPANQVRAIVLDRDDRPDAGLDASSLGWL